MPEASAWTHPVHASYFARSILLCGPVQHICSRYMYAYLPVLIVSVPPLHNSAFFLQLIHPKVLLTAGHCTRPDYLGALTLIGVNFINGSSGDYDGTYMDVSALIRHHKFKDNLGVPGKKSISNDIGLVILADPLVDAPRVKLVEKPKAASES